MNATTRMIITAAAPALMLVGCFTMHRTPQPATSMTRVPEGKDIKVTVSGFAANITEYVSVYGYDTVFVDDGWGGPGPGHGPGPGPGPRGRHVMHGGGHYVTTTSQALIPQARASEAFLCRARAHLEENGFLLRVSPTDYTVDVTFSGPFVTSDERALEWTWMLCSIFSAEYATQTWTAKLKIYDNKSGRIIFNRDYKQKFEDVVWSPIFFIGLAGYTENTFNFMQNWCLSSLTDQACADATLFLSGR